MSWRSGGGIEGPGAGPGGKASCCDWLVDGNGWVGIVSLTDNLPVGWLDMYCRGMEEESCTVAVGRVLDLVELRLRLVMLDVSSFLALVV